MGINILVVDDEKEAPNYYIPTAPSSRSLPSIGILRSLYHESDIFARAFIQGP